MDANAQILAFIIMLFIIAGMAASIGKKATPVKANSVLCLELNGTLSERVAEDPFEGLYGENKSNMALNDVLESNWKQQAKAGMFSLFA